MKLVLNIDLSKEELEWLENNFIDVEAAVKKAIINIKNEYESIIDLANEIRERNLN